MWRYRHEGRQNGKEEKIIIEDHVDTDVIDRADSGNRTVSYTRIQWGQGKS